MKTLGQKIKELRNALGLTQIELAENLEFQINHYIEMKLKSRNQIFCIIKISNIF